jgi:hypothetical protein
MAEGFTSAICDLPLWLKMIIGGLGAFVIVFLSGIRGFLIPAVVFMAVLTAVYLADDLLACS